MTDLSENSIRIFYAEKLKGRVCASEDVVREALKELGLGELAPSHLGSGAPVLLREDGTPSGLFVSVSDTARLILVCVAPFAVGIDAEMKSRAVKASAAKRLHPLERRYLEALEPGSSEWRDEFLRIWTAKESYMKFCGAGLSMGLAGFSALDEDLSFARTTQKEGHPRAALLYADGPASHAVSAAFDPEALPKPVSISFCKVFPEFPFETSALEKAALLLDRRDYSEKGLSEKLREKGYAEEEAREAGALLKERGYLDDGAFAQRLAEKLLAEGRGKAYVLRALTRKGVPADLAGGVLREALERLPSEEERAWLPALKAMGAADPEDGPAYEKALARTARKLSSLGYDAPVIWSVLEKLRAGTDE